MAESARIPFGTVDEGPYLRRGSNLDQVVELFKTIKHENKLEDEHALKLHETQVLTNAPLVAAQLAVDEAQKRVDDMKEAQAANQTLTVVMDGINLKHAVLEEYLEQRASLIIEEGTMKAPIIRAIGRTSVNLQAAVSAKQAALRNFAEHPSFTKDEIQQLLTTYDELVISIKKQLTELKLEASSVLTPIQLNINQTEHAIDRIKAEIIDLEAQKRTLMPIAEKFSSVSLEGSEAILATAISHYNTEKEAQTAQIRGFDQATQDRSSVIVLVDQLLTLLADIQQPQETSNPATLPFQPVKSLVGSVPVVKRTIE
jgi:hypothetical protein